MTRNLEQRKCLEYVSVCSGIEAATVAWHPLGWKPKLFAEIEKFPSAVLAHHYPEVPNVGDFTQITARQCGAVDVLVGGTPCQDFSVAGLRAGLDGKRGQLTIEYAHLADRLRPRWLVWENVPGVLSIDGGRAFGTFLALLGKLGYGFAYRVLDAQYFGVPQRRRRVFLVGYLGDYRRAAAVLFERHSLSGYPPPSREARQDSTYDIAPCLGASGRGFERTGDTRGQDCVVAFGGNNTAGSIEVSAAINAHGGTGRMDFESETLICSTLDASFGRLQGCSGQDANHGHRHLVPMAFDSKASGRNGLGVGDISPTLRSMGHADSHANSGGHVAVMTLAIRGRQGEPSLEVREDGIANAILTPNVGRAGIGVGAVAISANQRGEVRARAVHGSLNGTKSAKQFDGIMQGMAVRRLTPRECERLQGFPDDYTKIRTNTADGPRYKALGNSMAVPVMRWIGERISTVDSLELNSS